jgi:hypothetical protein
MLAGKAASACRGRPRSLSTPRRRVLLGRVKPIGRGDWSRHEEDAHQAHARDHPARDAGDGARGKVAAYGRR